MQSVDFIVFESLHLFFRRKEGGRIDVWIGFRLVGLAARFAVSVLVGVVMTVAMIVIVIVIVVVGIASVRRRQRSCTTGGNGEGTFLG